MPRRHDGTAAEAVTILRERALLMLAAFEREEPSATWSQFRGLVEKATRASDLRSLLREFRAITGAMSESRRRALERALRDRFGPDDDWERHLAVVARMRVRGRIRSEREYRSVQAYQDSIANTVALQDDFLALGALLDDFTAAP